MAKKYSSEDDRTEAKDWLSQIQQAEADRRIWQKRCDKIVRNYRAEVDETDTKRRLNLFWSNTETLKPAIYSKMPMAIVERRFLDKDPIGRIASQILERAIRYEMPQCGFHHTFKLVRDDYLMVGRGIPWLRYNPEFGEAISPGQKASIDLENAEGKDVEAERKEEVEEQNQILLRESLCVDYVYWKDWLPLGRPRVWDELMAVARRVYMTRQDCIKKFGEKKGKAIPLTHSPDDKDQQRNAARQLDRYQDQAETYEIWDKQAKEVIFVAKGYDQICLRSPGLGLEEFWPFPRPAMTNTTNGTLEPVPDYLEAQDQYIQINDLTRRIDVLTDACRVIGFYDPMNKEVSRAFTEGKEPQLIPVPNWAVFVEKGRAEGGISFVPIELISKTLAELIQVRAQIIQDLDRLTGVWDIMRGESDPNETKGAQQIKQQNGFGRLGERQEDFARMCRDMICIMGEVIAEHYDPKTLLEVSSALQDEGLVPQAQTEAPQLGAPSMQGPMPDPMQQKAQMIAEAIALLKNEKLRGFRIDIETDSTVQNDIQAEKQSVTELLKGVTDFVKTSAEVSALAPGFAPLAGKMLQFAFRRFRVGRDLETAIEEFTEEATKNAKEAAANPQPSPEQVKAQTEQMKAQAEIERQKIENEGEAYNSQMDLEGKKLDLEMRKIELAMKQIEHDHKVHASNMDLAGQAMELAQGEEGDGKSSKSPSFAVHPHVALAQIGEAAKEIKEAANRLSAPRRIVRDPQTGKALGTEPVQ